MVDSFLGFPNRGNSDSMLAPWRGAVAMGAKVSITRLDLTATALRAAAGREKNSAAARRMLALALVLDGVDRKTAAETCGMDHRMIFAPQMSLPSFIHCGGYRCRR
jgi:hypothetical protein